MKFFVVLVVSLALIAPACCKTFTRCSLAKELHALGVPKSELPQWTCIAKHESTFRTGVVGPPNKDGSNDYGIFQINDKYWCKPSNGRFSYNGCKLNCGDLLTDNISKSLSCARQIKGQKGWTSWSTWKHCSGSLPSINECF